MKKIFVFWIIFLVILIAGVSLAISSKFVLKREKERADELKKTGILRPSRSPKLPVASETKAAQPEKAGVELLPKTEETAKEAPATVPEQPVSPVSGEIPPMQNNIPVQINTNSLEISVSAPQSSNPVQEPQPSQTTPLAGQ
ncbi:MAG: hypothetical protein PHI59_03740 [Candidatus Omnitrophica bacterium]|nr:hypothetical protein [Candidatus Omnitrophota bacterium]